MILKQGRALMGVLRQPGTGAASSPPSLSIPSFDLLAFCPSTGSSISEYFAPRIGLALVDCGLPPRMQQ